MQPAYNAGYWSAEEYAHRKRGYGSRIKRREGGMSNRQLSYISVGLVLGGVLLLAWAALTGSSTITIIGVVAFFGGGIVQLARWLA
jgi:hypothetical protein